MTLRSRALTAIAAGVLIAVTGCGSAEDPGAAESPSVSPSQAPDGEPTSADDKHGGDKHGDDRHDDMEHGDRPRSDEREEPTPREKEPPPAKPAAIDIADFAFSGTRAVSPGATIMVTNQDSAAHSVTADGGDFDLLVDSGESGTFKAPTKPGKYPYFCKFHPEMVGMLLVR